MEENPPVNPGFVICTISHTARLDEVDIALGLSAALSNIAGPEAFITGFAGEHIAPRLNLVVCGLNLPQWRRAEDLILEPIESAQRAFQNYSTTLHPDRLDRFAASRGTDSHTHAAFEQGHAGTLPGIPFQQRRETVLRKPTFLWHGWLPEAVGETLDAAPFVCNRDGQLIRHLAGDESALRALVSALGGYDVQVGPKGSLARYQKLQAGLWMTCEEPAASALLRAPDWDLLWRQCLVCRPARPNRLKIDGSEWAHKGHKIYRERVANILAARREGRDQQQAPRLEAQTALLTASEELQTFVNDCPVWMRPLMPDVLSLSYRLLWTFEVIECRHDREGWPLEFAVYATREILRRQRDLFQSWFDTAAETDAKQAKIAMLTKLEGRPCVFRDLVRRYRRQRRELHHPVLMQLVKEGLVDLRQDGLLEISETGRRELAA